LHLTHRLRHIVSQSGNMMAHLFYEHFNIKVQYGNSTHQTDKRSRQ